MVNPQSVFTETKSKKRKRFIIAGILGIILITTTAVLFYFLQTRKNLSTEEASASATRDLRSYQVWSDPYNPDNPDCVGVQECLGISTSPGHLWSFTTSKDRVYDLEKMKSTVSQISNELPEYPDINTYNKLISLKAIFQIGDIEKNLNANKTYTACNGSTCGDEFTLNHCKDNVTSQFSIPSGVSYAFTNSLCGNETVELNFSLGDVQNKRYTLLVGWYTGGVTDQIDVLFDGIQRGSITTTTDTADVTAINTNLEGNKSHKLSFKGISGDGIGLDFIALVPVNYYDTFAIGDDVPTLQFEQFTKDNTYLIIGEDEKYSASTTSCFGSECSDEFPQVRCGEIDVESQYTINEDTNNFQSSICGTGKNSTINTKLDAGSYSLIVAWYTGSQPDTVDVKLNKSIIGTIQTKVATADWTIIPFNVSSACNTDSNMCRITFEGISGDGLGLDFIAIIDGQYQPALKNYLFTDDNTELLIGEDDRTPIYKPCFGQECRDELKQVDCSTIEYQTPYTIIDETNDFQSSLCGSGKTAIVKTKLNAGRYSLIVGWYTGPQADTVNVKVQNTYIGTIQTNAMTADWTMIPFDLFEDCSDDNNICRIDFEGVSGDGLGIDFIAITDQLPIYDHQGFGLVTENGVNTNNNFGEEFYYPLAEYVHTRGLSFGVEPHSYPVKWTSENPGEFTLIVGWYTGATADEVQVKFDKNYIGEINTTAQSAGIVYLPVNIKVGSPLLRNLEFNSISGDGFGIDFIAIVESTTTDAQNINNLTRNNSYLLIGDDERVNRQACFGKSCFDELATINCSKEPLEKTYTINFSTNEFPNSICGNGHKTTLSLPISSQLEIDKSKIDDYFRTFTDSSLGEKITDVVTISIDPLAYNYQMSLNTNLMANVITLADSIKRVNSSTIISFDQGNLFRHYCINMGGTCDFSPLEKVKSNESLFDYFFAYGYDFIWGSTGHQELLPYFVPPMYVDYKILWDQYDLSPMCYQINPTEGEEKLSNGTILTYHFDVKENRTINALNSLYNRYPGEHNLPCIQISGMNWQKTGTESPTFFLTDSATGMF